MNPSYQLTLPVWMCYDFDLITVLFTLLRLGKLFRSELCSKLLFSFSTQFFVFLRVNNRFFFNFLHVLITPFKSFYQLQLSIFVVRCSAPAGILSVLSSRDISARTSTLYQSLRVPSVSNAHLLSRVSLYCHRAVSLHLFGSLAS